MEVKLILSDKSYPAFSYLDKKGKYTVKYMTDEFETFSKGDLLKLKEYIGGDFTFKTNAGVDLHSSEDSYKGIKVEKLSFLEMDLITPSISDERL
jgi:hypothetical protein